MHYVINYTCIVLHVYIYKIIIIYSTNNTFQFCTTHLLLGGVGYQRLWNWVQRLKNSAGEALGVT